MKRNNTVLICVLSVLILCSCSLFEDDIHNDGFESESDTITAVDHIITESQTDDITETVTELLTETELQNEDTTEIQTEYTTESEDTTEPEEITNTQTSSFDFSLVPDDDGIKTVVLDAGHGFDDPGCVNDNLNGYYEKDITLKTVMKVKALLENEGIRVLLTHDGASFENESEILLKASGYGLTLKPEIFVENNIFSAYERTIYADLLCIENDADLFVSFHVNSNTETDMASGFMMDCCIDGDMCTESLKLLNALKKSVINAFPLKNILIFEDKWDDAFIVNKYILMPSVLIEMGYATNKNDAEELLDDAWLDEFAKAAATGILDYFET